MGRCKFKLNFTWLAKTVLREKFIFMFLLAADKKWGKDEHALLLSLLD
jgi:hypothetical protein